MSKREYEVVIKETIVNKYVILVESSSERSAIREARKLIKSNSELEPEATYSFDTVIQTWSEEDGYKHYSNE